MGVKTHLSVISGAEINLTVRAVTTYVLCCNLAPSMSALEMSIFSNIFTKWSEVKWIGTYCISCVVQQTSGVKDLSSLVRYDDSSLAAIRHVQSIIPVVHHAQIHAPTASCLKKNNYNPFQSSSCLSIHASFCICCCVFIPYLSWHFLSLN